MSFETCIILQSHSSEVILKLNYAVNMFFRLCNANYC